MKVYKFSELVSIIGGGTPKTIVPEYWNGEIPWLSVVDFGGDRKKVYSTEKTITEIGLAESSTKMLKKGQLIISARGTVGELAMLGRDMAFNQSCYGLDAKPELATNDFLYYLLKLQINNLKAVSHGSVFDTITKQTFDKIEVSIPDLPTQHRIASILSALDDKIELNRQMNQTLEQLAQTLFRQYFVEPLTLANQSESALRPSEHEKQPLGSLAAEEAFTPANREENGITLQEAKNLPSGWKIGTLEEIAEFSNGNAFSSKELLDCDTGNCYHVFKMGHIKKGGGLNAEGTKSYFPKGIPKKLEKYVLKKGDLLMCMTDMKDNVALLGHTALMNEDDKYIVNQRVGLLRANNSVGIGYPFLYLLTNSPEFLVDLRSRANSGVQVNLSTSEIKNTEVAIAPKEVNKSFHNSVEPLFEKMFQILKENQTLTQTRDTLLPKLMSGEINVLQAAKTGAYEPEQVLS